ncbi:MAG: hypothetical protein JST54_28960 [Deltaproteobacteria bacterium]|nr:hypothetical protein [Deltaproteobacteria bacterium]
MSRLRRMGKSPATRLAALETRAEAFEPPMRSRRSQEPLDPALVQFAEHCGCERHLSDGELERITTGEWMSRFSNEELVKLEMGARQAMAERASQEALQ